MDKTLLPEDNGWIDIADIRRARWLDNAYKVTYKDSDYEFFSRECGIFIDKVLLGIWSSKAYYARRKEYADRLKL